MRLATACLLVVSIAPCALPVRAALVVSIADSADRDALFWVQSKSNHAQLHGSCMKLIDEHFLRPGETARITVLTLNPLTFVFVYSSIYHPAYLYQSRQVRKMPSLLRNVTLPEFRPRAWREFIDAGEKVLKSGEGIHLGNVVDHFRLFLNEYLPAIDAAGGGDELRVYLPLFEEIIRHSEQSLPQAGRDMKIIDERLRADPSFAQQLDQTVQRQLKEMKDYLAQIRTLLSVSAQERTRLRALQAKSVNARSVYHELMSARDRQQIEDFLDFQYDNSRARPEKSRQWLSDDRQILYAITLGDRYALRGKDSRPLFDSCYRTGLNVDLYAGRPTGLKDTQKRVTASFCRSERGEWLIQLPRH